MGTLRSGDGRGIPEGDPRMTIESISALTSNSCTDPTTSDLKPSRKEGGRRCRPTSMDEKPHLSIITVVYNGAAHLATTIESVLALKTDTVEYLVIDGGSTDGTIELLRHYDEQLDYWLSEKDSGIYDAMNKGIQLANGEYIYHLNIGDSLLCLPAAIWDGLPPDSAGLAACVRIGENGLHKPSDGLVLRLDNTLHHQGCFYRRKADLRYDTHYRVYADFDLNQRLIKSGQRFVLCDDVVASHDEGGISHSSKHFHEVFEIIHTNYGLLWVVASFIYFKLRGLKNRMRLA